MVRRETERWQCDLPKCSPNFPPTVAAPILFSAFFLSQAIGLYQVRKFKVLLERERIEEASSRQAMEPILLAERDRDFLKELRKDRDWEKQLMSDVKGWEVGRL